MDGRSLVKKAIGFGILAVLILWFGVTVLVPALFSGLWSTGNAAQAGHLGEAFGAASGLFAGLGSLGVVIVLAYDLRHRKEEFRPFVTFSVEQVKLSRASWAGTQHFSATLDLDIALTSLTPGPALNLTMKGKATVDSISIVGDVVVANAPLPTDEARSATVNFSATGVEAEGLVRALASSGVKVEFNARYEALNGTAWRSTVVFDVKARPADSDDVLKTLDRTAGMEIEPSSTTEFAIPATVLEGQPIPGSWKQERA
jgi:hypothetical protein